MAKVKPNISAIGYESHTPVTPSDVFDRSHAAGMMTMTCLSRVMKRLYMPCPSAWKNVENVTPIAAGTKHRLRSLMAVIPMRIISSPASNMDMSFDGNIWNSSRPHIMMMIAVVTVRRVTCIRRSRSRAP